MGHWPQAPTPSVAQHTVSTAGVQCPEQCPELLCGCPRQAGLPASGTECTCQPEDQDCWSTLGRSECTFLSTQKGQDGLEAPYTPPVLGPACLCEN